VKPQVVIERQPEEWIRGLPLPRVTDVLRVMDKPALVGWAAKMATEYMGGVLEPGRAYSAPELNAFLTAAKSAHRDRSRAAADKGTEAHKWIQSDAYGQTLPMPEDPDVASSVNAYLEWKTQHDVEFVESELPFAHEELGFKGTLDCLAWVDSVFTLIDIKTSSGIYVEAYLQTAAYQKGVEPLIRSGQKIEQRIILHIPKDGRAANAITLATDIEEDWQGFRACLNLKRYLDYQKAATAKR